MEFNAQFWVGGESVNILVKDEKLTLQKRLAIDLEEILEAADTMTGEVFDSAVTLIEEHIQLQFPRSSVKESCRDEIRNWLKEYAALGQVKKDLTVVIVPNKGGISKMNVDTSIFEEVVSVPESDIQKRYQRLVGLDELKNKIRKEASVWLAPQVLEQWSKQYHKKTIDALKIFGDRYPFFIFEGDVGTGKTEFAETFGDDIARAIKKEVLLARVSMKSRGNGVVGEMSKLISKVFSEATNLAVQNRGPVILLLDEADSLAQSREESQMHHEDRAGVNALIQGIDKIRNSEFPVMVVFCTNRLNALDPAIRRRAAMVHTFNRPNKEQRLNVFQKHFHDLALNQREYEELVNLTGENSERKYGFTYSDLTTRLIPSAILEAYPDQPLDFNVIRKAAFKIIPTPPFNGSLL